MTVDRGHLATDLPPDEEHAPRRRVTLDDLHARRDEIAALARRYGVSNVRVTGFALDVEQLMGVFTQVATPNGLKKRIRARVLAEAVPL